MIAGVIFSGTISSPSVLRARCSAALRARLARRIMDISSCRPARGPREAKSFGGTMGAHPLLVVLLLLSLGSTARLPRRISTGSHTSPARYNRSVRPEELPYIRQRRTGACWYRVCN